MPENRMDDGGGRPRAAAEGETVLSDYKYTTLEEFFTQEQLGKMQIKKYAETPELLEQYELPNQYDADGLLAAPFVPRTTRWHSSLLKSNIILIVR